MILYEDEEIRIEEHITETWEQDSSNNFFRCGEKWSNGSRCNTKAIMRLTDHKCRQQFIKARVANG